MLNRAALVAGVVALASLFVTPGAAAADEGSEFRDDFDTGLDPGWVIRDGYAEAFPEDTANHASYTTSDGHLNITIPGGEEHNMWLLQHAQLVRPYLGSGVYEVKVDSAFTGDQQFGIVFESSPGTFMLFMLYAHGHVMGYVEQFRQLDGWLAKHTLVGFDTGVPVPASGPFFVRVTVDDHEDPTQRTWRFEWSRDGGNWHTGADGVLEQAAEEYNIGEIQSVSLFAGNQPTGFDGYEARFDYFSATQAPPAPPILAPVVGAAASSGKVTLDWSEVFPDDTYVVSRRADGAEAFEVIATVDEPHFVDTTVANDTTYHYMVAVVRDGQVGPPSAPVSATPHATGLETIPNDGLVTALLASELQLADGAPVTQWASVGATPQVATANGSSAPTFVASGIGGAPAVRFDGADDFLHLGPGYADLTAGMTMFVVAEPATLRPGMKMVVIGNGGPSGLLALGRAGTTSGLQYVTTNDGGDFGWFETPSGMDAGTPAVYTVIQGGGAPGAAVPAALSRNGAVLGSGEVYVPPVATRAANFIGHSYWPDGKFDGEIAEILVYDRQLSPSEVATVNAYLFDKYGITTEPAPEPEPEPEPPAAPAGLEVSAGDGSVSLSWSPVTGATGYRVQRSAAGAGSFTVVGEVTSPSFVDGEVTNGTAYDYRVTAVGVGGESAPSTVVTATPTAEPQPPAPPAAPAGLEVSAGDGSVSLSWSPVTGATGYRVQRSAAGAGSFTVVGEVTSPSFVDGEVTNGTAYDYRVTAVGVGGESAPSTVVTATPTAPLPLPEGVPLDGLVLSLDAGLLSGSDGAPVSVWEDNSGAGPDATASGSSRPTLVASGIGGRPAVRFDGVDDFLSLGTGFEDFTEGLSVFVVARPTALQSGMKMLLLGNGPAGSIGFGRAGSTAGVQYFTANAGESFGWFDTPSGMVAGDAAVYSVSQAGGQVGATVSATVARDGVVLGSGQVYVPPVGPRSANYVGNSYWPDERFAGEIAEILVYDRQLTPAETAAVNAHLAEKYGLEQAAEPALPLPEGVPLDGLVLSLDAGLLSGSDGAPVSVWEDNSGAGPDATASGSSRPTLVASGIGGRPAVRFDGVDDFLSLGTGFEDFTEGLSVFVVARPTALQSGMKMLLLGNGPAGSIGFGRAGSTAGVQYFTANAGESFGWFDTPSGMVAGDAAVYSVSQAGGQVGATVSATVARDGVVLGSGQVYVPPVGPRSANYVGNSYWPDERFAGEIAEILVYDRQLTPAETAAVNAHLAEKYGLD